VLQHGKPKRNWEKIGQRVKIVREARGMTQPDLAEKIGKHRATVARIETGVPISEGVLHSLAKALEVDYLSLTGHPDPLDSIVITDTLSAKVRPDKARMLHLHDLALDLAKEIVGWEGLDLSSLPMGKVLVANRKAHDLLDALEAVNEEMKLVQPVQRAQPGTGRGAHHPPAKEDKGATS